jgi:hypothetical protein
MAKKGRPYFPAAIVSGEPFSKEGKYINLNPCTITAQMVSEFIMVKLK